MYCPFCNAEETKVIDSRLLRETNQTRRRRECPKCKERFTTYETVELSLPRVVKRDGRREIFSEDKLRSGMMRALEKRPVSMEEVERAIAHILHKAMTSGERELPSELIGEWVMNELQQLDHVASLRFASVCKAFDDLDKFTKEISRLTKHAKRKKSNRGNESDRKT